MILLFVGTALLLVLLVHGFVWWRLASAFAIVSGTGRLVLAGLLLALLALVIVFSVLASRGDGPIVRWGYLIGYLWLGLLFQLFLWLMVSWPLAAVLAFWQRGAATFIPLCAVLLAVSATVFGLYQAEWGWRTISHAVPIADLPSALDGYRIAHLSDLHIGLVNRRDFVERAVTMTLAGQPDLVVITGDILDTTGHGHEDSTEPLARLARTVPTVAILGNHDTYFGSAEGVKLLTDLGIDVLRDERRILPNGLTITGADYPSDHQRQNISSLLSDVDQNAINLLLTHEPVQIPEASAAGYDLLLAGHTHHGQIWPFGLVTNLVYRGYDFGFHVVGQMFVAISPGLGTWGPFLKSSAPPSIYNLTLRRAEQ